MKKSLLLLLSAMLTTSLMADLTFTVNVPQATQHCYVVGELPQLSSWSAGSAVPMQRVGTANQFTVTIPGITAADVAASQGYKYICGPDWKYVEVSASNAELANRTIVGNPDQVAAWRNLYEAIGITENWLINGQSYPVQILLPEGYDPSQPQDVIYFFGRHQRYRDAGSDTEMGDRFLYADSWAAADTLAAMQARGHKVGILAIIYAQLPEFTPWTNHEFMGTGHAADFLHSFVHDFMPAFQTKYNIASGAQHTTIIGADVAGLFALYATLEHPQLFGHCALFSPAIWYCSQQLKDYAAAYTNSLATNHFALVTTSADVALTTNETTYYSQWLHSQGASVTDLQVAGNHDDITWGKALSSALLPAQQSTSAAIYKGSARSTAQRSSAASPWYFMKGEGTTALTCQATPTQSGYFYSDGRTPQTAQLLVQEIPVDSRKYTYYWNLNSSNQCDGQLLETSPFSIGFKESRKTPSWQRVAVFADGSHTQTSASADYFRANGVIMTKGDNFTLTASLSFTDSKTVSIHYGSVNSGSDMGELVAATVSDNCLKANILYSYLTNQLTITETAWGSSDIDLEYMAVEPAVVRPGTPATLKVKINNTNGYTVTYRSNHNNQPSQAITLTPGTNGEMLYTIAATESGIYGFYLDIELNGTLTKAHKAVYLKVLDGASHTTTILNPYKEIDWNNVAQYKSNLHTHTRQSNDPVEKFTTNYVVDRYHQAGYHILALTDHDYNAYPWQLFPQFMTSQQARDPQALGMLAVPGNELSKDNTNSWSERTGGQFNHHNDFFTGRQGQEFASLQESYAYTYALGGMQIINHPGQYWSINTTYSETDKDGPGWHAKNFQDFPSLVGLEVYNQGNRRPNDRILWDQILERTMPERPVFGYSGDDTHNDDQLFRNYNFMLMPNLTTDFLKDAMRKGESYFSYEPLGSGQAKAPRIDLIEVDEQAHTITIQSNGTVQWIFGTDKTSDAASSRRSTVVGIGNTFCYKGYQGSYVRALITNTFGETCTQPFGFAPTSTVGLDNLAAESDLLLLLYPNPAASYLSVFMNDSEREDLIHVFNLHGQEILREQVAGTHTVLPVGQLPSGMYMVVVGDRVGKFIKE